MVTYSSKSRKQYAKLPSVIQDRLDLLSAEIEILGPVRAIGPAIQN